MKLTVASFNLNNLFSRFNWSGTVDPAEDGVVYLRRNPDGSTTELDDVAFLVRERSDDRRRSFMGQLIKAKDPADTQRIAERVLALDADVLLVQEVEDQAALEDFNRDQLGGHYRQIVVLEGNDDRFIDVGIMVRGQLTLGAVTTWKHATHPDDPGEGIFSRDLLEAELLDSGGKVALRVFNTHLKSHFVAPFDHKTGRLKTPAEIAAEHERANERRRLQAETAMEIIEPHLDAPVVLAGDMNDPPDGPSFAAWHSAGLIDALADAQETQPPPPSARPEDRPTNEVWSHRFSQSNAADQFHLYDQLWISPPLDGALGDAKIHRRSRWTTDGSDHDPVSITIDLAD